MAYEGFARLEAAHAVIVEMEATGGHDPCALLEVQQKLAHAMRGTANLAEMTEHGRTTYLLGLFYRLAINHRL